MVAKVIARSSKPAARRPAFLADQIGELGPFEIVHDGRSGLPAACWTLKPGPHEGNFTLYDLADRLRYYGWQVCAYPLPGLPDVVVQRALIRHGVSRDMMRALIDDIRAALDWFRKHPINVPVSAKDGSGFHH